MGLPTSICDRGKFPKITELKLGFSRDGFHWHRPDRRAFIPASRTEGTRDRAYLHSTAGVCLIDGDRLLFPYCAFSGITPDGRRGMYYGASVGYAVLRRDGFASMDADANPPRLRHASRRCRPRKSGPSKSRSRKRSPTSRSSRRS